MDYTSDYTGFVCSIVGRNPSLNSSLSIPFSKPNVLVFSQGIVNGFYITTNVNKGSF